MAETTLFGSSFDQRTAERQAALKELAMEQEARGGRPWSPGTASAAAQQELQRGAGREAAAGGSYSSYAGISAPGGAPFTLADALRRLQTGHQAYYSAFSSLTGPLSQQLAVAEGDTWATFQQYLDEELERLQYGGP